MVNVNYVCMSVYIYNFENQLEYISFNLLYYNLLILCLDI